MNYLITKDVKKREQVHTFEKSRLVLKTIARTQSLSKKLQWKARLNLNETIEFVVNWYKNFEQNKKNTFEVSKEQIIRFMNKKK